jgi:hypothetical protein
LKRYEDLERHGKLGSLPSRYDIRFVRQRRKEYESAREILRTKIEQQLDPSFNKAREEHLHSIRNLIQEWHDNLKEVDPAMKWVKGEWMVDDWFDCCFNEDFPYYVPTYQEDLKAHLPFPDLWNKHVDWWGKLGEYSKNISTLEDIIRKEGQSWHVRLEKHFVYPAIEVVDCEYFVYLWGGVEYMEPSFLCDEQKLIAKYSEETWSILEADKPENYIARYESMVKRLIESKEVNKLFSTRKTINELMSEIRNRLSDILERREYIWRTCSRCPSPPTA